MEPGACPVRIETRRYPGGSALHCHAHHQVVLPLAGRMEMAVGGRGARLDGAQFAALAAGEAHEFEAPAGDSFLIVDLPETGTDPLWHGARLRPFLPFDPALRGFAALLAESEAGAGGRRAGSVALDMGAEVVAFLVEALRRRIGAAAPLPAPLARAMAAMTADLGAAHRVGEIARRAGTSGSRLHAAFRDCLGTTPMGWLTARRMEEARRLLVTGGLAVGEVAARVGYDDPAAFARAFRRAHGCAPGALRARGAAVRARA
ncbi:AraC family transcriptional regulator [Limibaculum sp. FT325]|uniref:helix-turn-helix transcriptional regulator n=1 Tax=Thermohalobaculum sediminis TaxID=2939436 RepID=UPI0020C16796|nr:AraC family transcriptional regulator [Limibaculum sediminis]MCL5778430.1 AraC family transcriptional regulator [Limibaculum sediminis]